jgi:glycosyltransferase involved in cell wall biosynthesis
MSKHFRDTGTGLRIVVVGTRGIPNIQGGVETHCEMLYPLLVAQGHQVTVIGRAHSLRRTDPFEFQGVRVVPTWSPRRSGVEALIHTFLAVFRARWMGADIIHIHAIGPAIFAPLARLLGLKVVVTHHGPDYCRQKWGFIGKTFLRLGEAMGAMFANRVIAISEGIRLSLRKKFHCENCDLIFNGVVIPKPDPKDEIDATLSKYGLLGKKYVLGVGRVVPEKGFEDLLSAIGGRADLKVVIVGGSPTPTPYAERLKESAKACGAILTGELDKKTLGHLYRGASLFVMPSYHEGLPIALLEAMSFGVKLLVSDIGPNREVGLPEDCYFRTGSVFALRTAAVRLLAGGSQRDFTEMLRSRYNWDSIAAKIGALYETLDNRPIGRDVEVLPVTSYRSASAFSPRPMTHVDSRLSLAKKET